MNRNLRPAQGTLKFEDRLCLQSKTCLYIILLFILSRIAQLSGLVPLFTFFLDLNFSDLKMNNHFCISFNIFEGAYLIMLLLFLSECLLYLQHCLYKHNVLC